MHTQRGTHPHPDACQHGCVCAYPHALSYKRTVCALVPHHVQQRFSNVKQSHVWVFFLLFWGGVNFLCSKGKRFLEFVLLHLPVGKLPKAHFLRDSGAGIVERQANSHLGHLPAVLQGLDLNTGSASRSTSLYHTPRKAAGGGTGL